MHLVNPQVYFKCIAQSISIDDLTMPYSIMEPEPCHGCWLKAASTASVGFPGKTLTWPRHWRTQIPTLGSQARLTCKDLIEEESCCDEPAVVWCCLWCFFVLHGLDQSYILLWCKLATICWLVNMQGSTRQGLRASSVLTKEDKHILGKS